MNDRSSRHYGHPSYRCPVLGREVDLYEPRFRKVPPAVQYHTVQVADRLDLLAQQYVGDPHQYWRIADSNADTELDALLDSGRILSIPQRP